MAANELFDSGIKITGSFSGAGAFPVDGKYVVDTVTQRDDHVTQNRAYEGMQVYVKENGITYQYTKEDGWVDFGKEERVKALELDNINLKKRIGDLESEEFASTDDIDEMFPDEEIEE